MAADAGRGGRHRRWRVAIWGTASLVMIMPMVAEQVTDEMAWDLSDFVLLGAMLAGACSAYEVAVRATDNTACRAAVALTLATAVLLVWMNFAVGIIGSEDNPANLLFFGVLAIALVGALLARLRPRGAALALAAAAMAQASVGILAGTGHTLILTGLFVGLWLTSAHLFRRAADQMGFD